MNRPRRLALACAAALLCMTAASRAAPPRISDDVVKIVVLTDLSGAFRDDVGPGSIAATQLAIDEKAGIDHAGEVMKTLKTMPIDDAFAPHSRVRADGKMVHDLSLVQIEAPAGSHDPWDD